MSSDGWITVQLGDLIEIKHGFAFKGKYFSDEPTPNILLTPGNFAIGGGFKYDKLKYYDGPVPEEYVLSMGDLLVTMTDLSKGADTLGYPAIVPLSEKAERYLHNQRLGLITIKRPEDLDARFLYYLMCTREYRHHVIAGATGTTVKHTSPTKIRDFVANIPPLERQRRIASILGSLDDKIELNRRMNRTLERMAQALFKSWFIDFDPVRAKAEGDPTAGGLPDHLARLAGRQAALFPGGLVDSELGEIPEGWEVGKLADVADNPRRTVQPSGVPPATPYIGLQHMPRRSIALDAWGRADEVGSGKSRFREGEILFGKLRPYFHKVGIAPLDGVCSTDILIVVPKSVEWHGYVLSLVSSKPFVDYTDSHSAGTKMPRTNWKDMGRYPLALPPDALAMAFQYHVAALHQRIGLAVRQNRRLAGLRDTLLPKLLSGELEVPQAEAAVEEVV